jgi:predicted membrane-bound spermidine synthase
MKQRCILYKTTRGHAPLFLIIVAASIIGFLAGIKIPDALQMFVYAFLDEKYTISITHEYRYAGAIAGFILSVLFVITRLTMKDKFIKLPLCVAWCIAIPVCIGLMTINIRSIDDLRILEAKTLSEKVIRNDTIGSIVANKKNFRRFQYALAPRTVLLQDTTAQYIVGDNVDREITGYKIIGKTEHFLIYEKEIR